MNRALAASIVLAATATLAACSRNEPEPAAKPDAGDRALAAIINVGGLALARDAVTIRAAGQPEARVEAGGKLFVDGSEVAVNETQRAELVAYHAAAMQLRESAKDTGIAGAKVGVAAAGAVLEGLAKGDPDSIGPKVEAEAAKVKQAAGKVCDDLDAIRKAQDVLAADLEAFRPYVTVKERDVTECRDGLRADEVPAPSVSPSPPETPAPADAPPAQEVAPAEEGVHRI
jgi:hypothetical protein